MTSKPIEKVVVVVDLSRYQEIAQTLDGLVGAPGVKLLNNQISDFIEAGLAEVGLTANDITVKETGDGGILLFEDNTAASRFAEVLHQTVEVYNRGKESNLELRHFRIGICAGEVVIDDTGEFAGFAIVIATRLESACKTGEVLLAEKTWIDLPPDEQLFYGHKEEIRDKHNRRLFARRRVVTGLAPWDRGAVNLARRPLYVERPPIEKDCLNAILEPGALIRITAPKHLGKTWLTTRILDHAVRNGYQTLKIDVDLAASATRSCLEEFLKWLCIITTERLGLPERLDGQWGDGTSNHKATRYFRECILHKLTRELVIALDGLDLIFENTQVVNDFSGLLRSWSEQGRIGDRAFKKLHFIIAHSTDIYALIDINQSPLAGLGLTVNLPPLEPEQVHQVGHHHDLSWSARHIDEFAELTGGIPFFVTKGIERITLLDISPERFLKTAHTEAGIYGDHLLQCLSIVEKRPELLAAVKQLARTSRPLRLEKDCRFQLDRMGLVTLLGDEVTFICELYRKYFSNCLANTSEAL